MRFSQHSPGPRLTGVVKTIWRASGTRAEFSAPEPILPDGCVEIIFNLGDRFVSAASATPQPRVLLAGQMTTAVVALPTGEVDLLGVRFFTARAGRALRVPMRELQDSLLDASAVVPRIDRLADDLVNLPDGLRLTHLDAHLPLPFLNSDGRSDSAIDHALACISAHRGNIPINRVARAVGISRRHLERRFNDEVGLGAKQIARIMRVHAALELMARQPRLSGAAISSHCGYSDQAHLIRECKALTGRTPARLTTSARSLAGLLREGAAGRSA
jgi:AraC-like DNA-binding protein